MQCFLYEWCFCQRFFKLQIICVRRVLQVSYMVVTSANFLKNQLMSLNCLGQKILGITIPSRDLSYSFSQYGPLAHQ